MCESVCGSLRPRRGDYLVVLSNTAVELKTFRRAFSVPSRDNVTKHYVPERSIDLIFLLKPYTGQRKLVYFSTALYLLWRTQHKILRLLMHKQSFGG